MAVAGIKVKDYSVSYNGGGSEGDEKWSDSGYTLKESNEEIRHIRKKEESRRTPRFLASANRWMKSPFIKTEKDTDKYKKLHFRHVV